jgi:hypothetical protein
MSITPERRVKNAVAAVLTARNAWYCYPATAGYGRSGVPDFLVCYRGRFIGIECKAEGNTTTALQDREIAAIRAAKGDALVVCGLAKVTEVGRLLDQIDNELKESPCLLTEK